MVKKEEVEAPKTLLAREQAGEQWGVSFTCAGDLLAVAATAAGVAGVAERVKTNWRRRAGIADPSREPKNADPTDTDDPNAPGGPFGPPLTREWRFIKA